MHIKDLADQQVRQQIRQLAKTVDVLDEHERERKAATVRSAQWHPNGDGRPSICRAVLALSEDPRTGVLQWKIPAEYEQSQRLAQIVGREPTPGYLFWPITRDLTAAVAGAGGYLVDGRHPVDAFAPAARAADPLGPLGVGRISLQSNGRFVRMSGDVAIAWQPTEATQATESTPAFVEAVATPKTAIGYVEASRAFMQNISPAAESFLMSQFGQAMGAERGRIALQGTGAAGQPLGLLGTSGITTASGASLTWTIATQTMHDVSLANSIINAGSLGWALSPAAELVAQRREKATGSGFILADGKIDSKRAIASNAVTSGVAVYGDWSQLVVIDWGVIEVGVDKYGAAGDNIFRSGRVGIRVIYSMDLAVIRKSSFSILTGVT